MWIAHGPDVDLLFSTVNLPLLPLLTLIQMRILPLLWRQDQLSGMLFRPVDAPVHAALVHAAIMEVTEVPHIVEGPHPPPGDPRMLQLWVKPFLPVIFI